MLTPVYIQTDLFGPEELAFSPRLIQNYQDFYTLAKGSKLAGLQYP